MHPDVAVVRAQFATAQAAIRTAGERPNPSVSLAPQFAAPLRWLLGTYGVDFDIPIETGGKRASRLALAREQAAAAGFHVVEASWQVRSRLRKAMLALSAASQREGLLKNAVGSQEQVIKLIEQRVAAGEAARPDFVQSRLLLNQLRLQLVDASRQKAEARASVGEALGMSVSALEQVTLSLSEFERVPAVSGLAAARRNALLHRADVLAALADYAASEATLRSEVAKQYPDIHLGPGYQWDAGLNKWAVGLGFTLPIFNQNRGAIAEAEAKRREAAAKFTAIQARVVAETERALAAEHGARAKVATATELLAAQDKQLQSAQALAKGGETDRLSVASAQLERDSAAIAQIDAVAELHTALGQLEDAVQTPLIR
jgi:outer membrane protein TolC